MSSKIKYQKNYTEFNETYQLVLPLSLEGFVPDDDSVRLLSHVQNPNLCLFPKHLFFPKNWAGLPQGYQLYVVACRTKSTRSQYDCPFPNRISRGGLRRPVLSDGAPSERRFIDGTKLEACANKYTFVWKKSVGKWEEKMFHSIGRCISGQEWCLDTGSIFKDDGWKAGVSLSERHGWFRVWKWRRIYLSA